MSNKNSTIIPGIYIFSKSIIINEIEYLLITLEGLDKYNENLQFAYQLRNIIFLLSSVVIFDTNETIENCIQKFNNIFKYMKLIKSKNNQKELSKDYLSKILYILNFQNENDITKINNEINPKKIFPKFEIFNKYNKNQKTINYITKFIKENVDLKKLDNITLNGNIAYGLFENLCENFNLEEMPVVDEILENILLSSLNEVAENIISQFQLKINKQIQENGTLNIYDIFQIFYTFLKDDGFSPLYKSNISHLISLKDAETYILKIFGACFEEIDGIYKSNLKKYNELVNNFGNDLSYKNDLQSFKDMKIYLNNFSLYLKQKFRPIIAFEMFSFDGTLDTKVNKYIINNINSIGENIISLTEHILKENNLLKKKNDQQNLYIEQKNKEFNEKKETIFMQELEYTKITREIKTKEKEFENNLEIEKKKCKKIENFYKNLMEETQKKINDLENKLLEASKENNFTKNIKKTNTFVPGELSTNELRSIFTSVTKLVMQYKEDIENVNNPKNTVYQSNAIESYLKNINKNFDIFLNKLENEIVEDFEHVNENYVKNLNKCKKELDDVNFENTKLKIKLKESELNYLIIKKQIEDDTQQFVVFKNVIEVKNSLITSQKKFIQDQSENIKTLEKTKSNLELTANDSIVKYKLMENDVEILLDLFHSILSKKKDNSYEHNFKKLSEYAKNKIEDYNREFRFFK